MKWFDKWFYKHAKKAWEMKGYYEDSDRSISLIERNMKLGTAMAIDRGSPEGEGRISFELSTAIGGRILNVRRYDQQKDRHDNQTYVIPNGEDIGERVAKIVNLEMFKG